MTGPDVERLREELEEALESGDPQGVLASAEALLETAPGDVDALLDKAEALAVLDRPEEAHDIYRELLENHPKDLSVLHATSGFLVFELSGDPGAQEDALELIDRALKVCRKVSDVADRQIDLLLLKAFAWQDLGAPAEGLKSLEEADRLSDGNDSDVACEKGRCLFWLLRLDEARAELNRALERDEENARAHQSLGLVLERLGKHEEAARSFESARRLAPEDYPEPIAMSDAEFERVVEEGLQRLPERVRSYLENVAIMVEELPEDADLVPSNLSPESVGLFRGTPVTEQSLTDPWSHFPSAILLYKRNLCRFAHSRDALIEEIGLTLLHEVGHFLGLDEDDLFERGLD